MSKVPQKEMSKNFCNILRKTIATGFVFYCDAKNSDTLQGSSHAHCFWEVEVKNGRSLFDYETRKSAVSQE